MTLVNIFFKAKALSKPESPASKTGRTLGQAIWTMILLVVGGLGALGEGAIAQSVTEGGAGGRLELSDDGSVFLDNNAFDFRTGELENGSDTPLPSPLPRNIIEGVAQPVDRSRESPNTIELTPDVPFIENALNEALGQDSEDTNFLLVPRTLDLQTRFNVNYVPGDHNFGEGIQTTVIGPNGEQISQDTVFVRGDEIVIGPDGQRLPDADSITVNYSAGDTVELRVLNIRGDGANPSESAIYFSEDAEFVVEDLQNGGDLDFDDGEYVRILGGSGGVDTREESEETTQVVETDVVELDPEVRADIIAEESEVIGSDVQQFDEIIEETERGDLDLPDTITTRLGHASGVRTDNDEQLIYSRYTSENQFRLGSDGLSATGQLRPLIGNPKAPPTLLLGTVNFNPFVGDNEAGLSGTLGITQYLTRTHRQATDMFGNPIENPGGPRLLEPAGLFNNRRMVGYVPTTSRTIIGDPLSSTGGIFDLPSDLAVIVDPPNPAEVGRGDSAYTDNVGGLIIEYSDGSRTFVPQWTAAGYRQEPLDLFAGEASRIVYALVPQQAGQALALGETYAVSEGAEGYQITDGGFTIISADRQPENFEREMAEIYAVEDTLPTGNTATSSFNGIRGVYAETFGGVRVPTVDVTDPAEADARVGNTVRPTPVAEEIVGQRPYVRTTRAAGLYLGGALSLGVGNQEDTFRRSVVSLEQETDRLRVTRTMNMFFTPRTRPDEVVFEVTQIEAQTGVALFDIDENGELTNIRLEEGETVFEETSREEISRTEGEIQRGEEFLVGGGPLTETTEEAGESTITELDRDTTTDTDTYPNVSALQGEIALGGVLNFGNTPWTTAANTVRAELFAQDTVIGRGSDGTDVGWRTELAFHPFGERKRDAYQYDADGNVVPVYKTEIVRDADGSVITETFTDAEGNEVTIPVSQFVLNENGEKVIESVGTGVATGPGLYVRLEDVFDDDEGLVVAGGLQYSF